MNPYKNLPNTAFWRRSVASIAAPEIDPVVNFQTKINRQTKVATAGSCFAQHIARKLREAGYCYYVTEPGHPIMPKDILEKHSYGTFSARYGNIYTAKQLLQLLKRAYGEFNPIEDHWENGPEIILDPYRPTVQPGGYVSIEEMRADRDQHLAAVRRMVETMDVFIFTLGLTEYWFNQADGAVFPLCPGVEGGQFDSASHAFHNATASEVAEDMRHALSYIHTRNPSVQILLTVSPVPLMATAQTDRHVLTATSYSKAVLRVAAEEIVRVVPRTEYFPSYEIITSSFNRGQYFASDLRNVTESGVDHVMRVFFKNATDERTSLAKQSVSAQQSEGSTFIAAIEQAVQTECDESKLDEAAG